MENPFKRPFPSDEFGGYGAAAVMWPNRSHDDPDWYSVGGMVPELRINCALPSAVSVVVEGVTCWRAATHAEQVAFCDQCQGCWVWWRRASENPRWKPARLEGGAQ